MVDTHSVAGHAYADFTEAHGRARLVDLLPPVLPELVHGVDTTDIDATDIDSPLVDFGHHGPAGAPQ